MKQAKCLLIALLAVILVLGGFPVGALAAEKAPERAIVLVMDNSSALTDATMQQLRENTIRFCTDVMTADKDCQIGLVVPSSVGAYVPDGGELGNSLDRIVSAINAMDIENSNNCIFDGLQHAKTILEESGVAQKNVVFMSSGLGTEVGYHQDYGDHKQYAYDDFSSIPYDYIDTANDCYNLAQEMGESTDIYTVGVYIDYQNTDYYEEAPDYYDNLLHFGQRVMGDMQNSGYFELDRIDDLTECFVDVPAVKTPLSVVGVQDTPHEASSHTIITATLANPSAVPMTNVNLKLTLDKGWYHGTSDPDSFQERYIPFFAGLSERQVCWEVEFPIGSGMSEDWTIEDGELVGYTIDITADHMVPLVYKGTVQVHSDSETPMDNRFVNRVDTYSFHNYSDKGIPLISDFHNLYMTAEDKKAILGAAPANYREYMKEGFYKDGKNGHCYAMSASAIAVKMGAFDMTPFSGTDTLFDAEFTDRVRSILCYWQMTQALPGPKAAAQRCASMATAEKLALLDSAVAEVQNGGTPALFCFYSGETSVFGYSAGHALAVFDAEDCAYTSPMTGKTYTRMAHFYDPNQPEADLDTLEDTRMYYNLDTGDWVVPFYESSSDDPTAAIERVITDINEIAPKDYDSSVANYRAELKAAKDTQLILAQDALESGLEWLIPGRNGAITGPSPLLSYHDVAVGDDGGSARNIILPDDTAAYTLQTASGDAEPIEVSTLYANTYQSVTADSAVGASVDPGGNVSLTGNTGAFTLLMADNALTGTGFDAFTIEGDNAGDYGISNTEGKVTISGNDLHNLLVTGSTLDTEKQIAIDTDANTVQVAEADGELVVSEDADGDGTYEKEIAVSDVAAYPGGYPLGDIDESLTINAADALQALRHSVKEIELTDTAFTRGNVVKAATGKEEAIDASDALDILRYSVKEINGFERG